MTLSHVAKNHWDLVFATESLFRWLTSLEGTGPLSLDSFYDQGIFAQDGVFLVPERLELVFDLGIQFLSPICGTIDTQMHVAGIHCIIECRQ